MLCIVIGIINNTTHCIAHIIMYVMFVRIRLARNEYTREKFYLKNEFTSFQNNNTYMC